VKTNQFLQYLKTKLLRPMWKKPQGSRYKNHG